MDRAESPDQVTAINSDHLALREQVGQNIEGNAVVRVIEHRNQYQSIGDVEVGITGGQSPARETITGAGMGSSTIARARPSRSVAARKRRIFSRSGS